MARSRPRGEVLEPSVRTAMEAHFGYDFRNVRVFHDSEAAAAARAQRARGYAVGQDIVFGAGEYRPSTAQGRRLIAHELAHVVQQAQGLAVGMQRDSIDDDDEAGDVLEHEAEHEAAEFEDAADTTADDEVVIEDDVAAPEVMAKGGGKGKGGGKTKSKAKGKDKTQEKPKQKPPANPCTRRILAEGTCQDLVSGSKFICCNPDSGLSRPGRTEDIDGTPCPSEKFTPIFTCDSTCKKALAKGCDDNDNWMALPPKQFSLARCGEIFTICANGKQTTGYVRDRSVTKSSFEVSPGIQKQLGVKVGDTFLGSIFRPGVKQATIDKDKCCK